MATPHWLHQPKQQGSQITFLLLGISIIGRSSTLFLQEAQYPSLYPLQFRASSFFSPQAIWIRLEGKDQIEEVLLFSELQNLLIDCIW